MERAVVPTYFVGQEQARLVLGVCRPPRKTPLRYARVEAKDQELELIPDYTYYYKNREPLIDFSSILEVDQ